VTLIVYDPMFDRSALYTEKIPLLLLNVMKEGKDAPSTSATE
jgi:hypothetical protein